MLIYDWSDLLSIKLPVKGQLDHSSPHIFSRIPFGGEMNPKSIHDGFI